MENSNENDPSPSIQEEALAEQVAHDQIEQPANTETQNTLDTDAPQPDSVLPPEPTQPQKPNHKLRTILLSVLGGILIIGGVIAVLLLFVLKKEAVAPAVQTMATQPAESEAIGTPTEVEVPLGEYAYIEPVFIDPGVTWQDPVLTSLQGYLRNEIQQNADNTAYSEGNVAANYYIAGTFPGGKVIYLTTGSGPLDGTIEVYLVKDGAKAELLKRYQSQFTEANDTDEKTLSADYYDTTKVTLNRNTLIKGTYAPETLVINGQKMSLPKYKNYNSTTDPNEYSNRTGSIDLFRLYEPTSEKVVTTIPEGTIYELSTPKDGYSLSLFELELPNRFRLSYKIDGELSNAEVQPIVWTDGTRNTAMYESFGAGCGGGQYSLIANITKNELTQIGKSDKGQPIYIFKDMNQSVASKILSEVNGRDNKMIFEDTNPPYTADEFLKDRAVIIVEDGMGRWVVFKNLGNFIQGGCAKPVIYLYPEIPLLLNIQVGADVTISEPQYETNGWQNVTALPSGQLLYRGLPYESLFWEGLGHGTYTDKSGTGVVVPRSGAVPTMYRQLAEQGFNQKESDDFVEFWSLNIPSGDYIRLTWLSTSEMNELAPLHLNVTPDTVIRTFLEMEGLSQLVELSPQKFTAPARNGFVLTEWGGLATNGLDALVVPDN